jgi:hypothetical protein
MPAGKAPPAFTVAKIGPDRENSLEKMQVCFASLVLAYFGVWEGTGTDFDVVTEGTYSEKVPGGDLVGTEATGYRQQQEG